MTERLRKVRINPGACIKCPFFYPDDVSCTADNGPRDIDDIGVIDPGCPLRSCYSITVYLREDQRTSPVKSVDIQDTKPNIEEVVEDMIKEGLLCDDDDWP